MAAETKAASRWQHVEGNVFIASPERALQPVTSDLPALLPHVTAVAPIVGALLIAGATVFAAFVTKTAQPPACAQARSHFDASRGLDDVAARKVNLQDHVSRFADCGLAAVAAAMLVEMERALHPTAARGVPVVPTKPVVPVQFESGERYSLKRGDLYAVQPGVGRRTRAMVVDGYITLSKDGVEKFRCESTEFWMNHSNEHHITACSDSAVIRVLGVD
jgi:hypothetical protein